MLLSGIIFCLMGFMQMKVREQVIPLPAGTAVFLETRGALNSHTLQLGSVIPLTVLLDVVAENQVVIRTGAFATARVCGLATGRPITPDEFEMELSQVQMADGKMGPLKPARFRFKARRLNEPVEVAPNQLIDSETHTDIQVTLQD